MKKTGKHQGSVQNTSYRFNQDKYIGFYLNKTEAITNLRYSHSEKIKVPPTTSIYILIAGIFALVTIATMLGVVLLLTFGFKKVSFGRMERYTHAIAGAIIFLSGFAISFLGL